MGCIAQRTERSSRFRDTPKGAVRVGKGAVRGGGGGFESGWTRRGLACEEVVADVVCGPSCLES